MLRRRVLLAGCALLLGVLAHVPPVQATSFQVSPTRFEFGLQQRFTNFFTVTNNSAEALRIRVQVAFLDVNAEQKLVAVQGSPHDMSAWVVLNPRRFSLQPGGKRVVRFSVRPPPGLNPGEYRSVVLFEELPGLPSAADADAGASSGGSEGGEAGVGSVRITLRTRLGITLYGRVGEVQADLALTGHRMITDGDVTRLEVYLGNEGTLRATVDVTAFWLLDAGGEEPAGQGRITIQRAQSRLLYFPLQPRPEGASRLRIAVGDGTAEVLSTIVPADPTPNASSG